MKTKLIYILVFFFTGFFSFSQEKGSEGLKLTRIETNASFRFIYQSKNWNDTFKPSLHDLSYDLVGMKIDTSRVYPIVRNVISPNNYSRLNKSNWHIITKLTGYGKIVSVAFIFHDESGVDNLEFARLADHIEKEVRWKLFFNKPVKDQFYLELSFPGPKL